MPAGSEFPELRKTVSQNFSPPMWDSADPSRRPAPLPKNTNPELHPITSGSMSPTKGSPTKSFTPASVHKRLNSIQTQSSSNVRDLSNAFNTQINGPKPASGVSSLANPFKNDPTKKDKDRDVSSVSIPPLFSSARPKDDLSLSRSVVPSYSPTPVPHHAPSTSNTPTPSFSTDRFTSAINTGDFQVLSGQLTNLLNITTNLQKEMSNLSRRSKDNAMDLMSLKEATSNRDEDIRKSLKDLTVGLGRPGGPGARLAITSGPSDLDFDGALTRFGSAPDIHRSFVSDAEEVLRQSQARRKSIGKDIQATMDNHNNDRIVREMATKESQRRLMDLLQQIQTEILAQGKAVTSKFSEVLRNIQSAGLSGGSHNAVVRYGGRSEGDENTHGVVLDLLEVLKNSMEERMDDLQNSLSLISNGSSRGTPADISGQLRPLEDAVHNYSRTAEELKDLINDLPSNGGRAELSPMLDTLFTRLDEISTKIEMLPRQTGSDMIPHEEGAVSTIELKDMLRTLIEMASRNESGTRKAVEVLMQEIKKIVAATSQNVVVPTSGEGSGNTENVIAVLQPIFNELKAVMADIQGDVGGQEKMIEKALEIILREVNKITPAMESRVSSIVPTPEAIASTTHANLQQDFGNVHTRIATVEGTIRDSMHVIQTQLQVITENVSSQALVVRTESRDGEQTTTTTRPHFDGSVAAVSAIGAMGKDLKHTMENLQSDINGREKVTEKAMEIILREVATINKAVSGVPSKVIDTMRETFNFGDEMKQSMQELQADVLGREKHTEKALEIILRELQTVAANFDKAQLAFAHSQEQKANILGQTEKDIKFNLETILTRSNRIADNTASLQELMESYQASQAETANTTQTLIGTIEASIKAPVADVHALLTTLQEQFKSSSSNTAQSIIEVAKYLDTLGEKASASAEQSDSIKKSVATVQENIQNFDSATKEMNAALIKHLESMTEQLQESNSKAIESSKKPIEEELTQEKEANAKVITELKGLIDSLKEGFAQSVVTTETRNSELSQQLESYCQSAREDQQKTQSDIHSVKESVLSLQSDDGTLAKILLAMKDVAEYLAKSAAAEAETKEDPKLAEIHQSLTEVSDLIKAIPTSNPVSEEDNAEIKTKLETLINHSNHQAQFFSQMSLLDEIQKQVQGTSTQVSEFVSNQTTLLETTAATERHEAAEANLAKERALADKAVAEATTAALKAEELNIHSSIASLKLDNDELIKKKQHLSAELSSLETALALRREEMALLENRAEALEKRMVEGVINQSRSLLLAKSTAAAAKPLRRIVNPPAVGTIRSVNGSGRRIVSMNLTNNNPPSTLGISETQNRTPSGSSIFPNTSGALRRAQSVRTSTHTSRKTSWSVREPVIQDDIGGENKENEVTGLDGHSTPEPTAFTLPVITKDEPPMDNIENSIAILETELGLATLDTIEDDDTEREESADKAVVLASDEVTRNEKRYPSGLSASSGRRSSIGSEIVTPDEEVD
ncbi:hypothetical protein ABW19_dt0209311 [Dactylella cylindrospora]|nr:hypothetical protein ABW19_dt0209311 [Dactylella cylindrospora]